MATDHVDKPSYDARRYPTLVKVFLQGQPPGATLAQVALGTGLAHHWVEDALRDLAQDYPLHLAARPNGELYYQFDFANPWRPAPTAGFGYRLRQLGRVLWVAFQFGVKVALFALLLAYGSLFAAIVALVLVGIFGLSFFGNASRVDLNGFITMLLLGAAAALVAGGAYWLAITLPWWLGLILLGGLSLGLALFHSVRVHGLGGLRPRPPDPTSTLGLFFTYTNRVFYYLFDGPQPPADPLATEKRLLAYASVHAGQLTAGHAVRLMGWPLAQAERQLTQLLLNHHGTAQVTPAGVIVYTFADLASSQPSREARQAAAQPVWERPLPLRPENPNDQATNEWIMGILLFVLVMAGVAPFLVPAIWPEVAAHLPWLNWYLGYVPGGFGLLFLTLPRLRRWLVIDPVNREVEAHNRRLPLMKKVFAKLGRTIFPAPDEQAQMAQLALDWEAETVVDEERGQIGYRFARLATEFRADE
ncbi:MAG: hypothetical protein MUC97_17205 [Bernardetiaceae bacterium]|jgi:hypothetical protein|nr:hypothetical protein [Bernardetiaceae bacterium]